MKTKLLIFAVILLFSSCKKGEEEIAVKRLCKGKHYELNLTTGELSNYNIGSGTLIFQWQEDEYYKAHNFVKVENGIQISEECNCEKY